jgi:hypothetical protein
MSNSPDVSSYVDLTLFDSSSQAIFEKALDYALVALPELQPREGSIETILLQAVALEVQDAIYAINRLPGAVVEVLLRLLDVERNSGTRATAVARFEGDSTTSFSVPIGTRLFYQANPDSAFLLLETTEAITATHEKAISEIDDDGTTTITVTTSTRHGLNSGDSITISGTTGGTFDGTYTVDTVPDGVTLTIDDTTGGVATGTVGTLTPDVTVPATGFPPVRSTEITEDFNGLLPNTELRLLSVISQVANVFLETTLTGGILAESDSQYFARASSTLSRLSASLTTPTHIQQYIAESGSYPEVYRVKAVSGSDETRTGNLSANVMIAVAPIDAEETNLLSGTGDGTLTVDDVGYGVKDEVFDGVSTRVHAALNPVVVDPAFVTIEATVTVKGVEGYTTTQVQNACESVLNSYISPNTWDWDTTLRSNEVIYQLRNATIEDSVVNNMAVDYVQSVELLPTDVYVPDESTYNKFAISSISRTSNVVTITTSAAHGVTIGVGEKLYIKVDGVTNTSFNTAGLVEASTASGSTFTFPQTAANASSSGGDVIAFVKVDASGNVVIDDPAPLIVSGTHTVTAVVG